MNRLALTSTIIGAIIIVARAPGLVVPDKFRAASLKFPRSVFWGRVLMAVAAAWVGIAMFTAADNDWPSWAKPAIIIGVPIAYVLVINYADQFLTFRGLAVLLLLAAKIMVDAADTSNLPARLFVTTLAYIWVVAAMWMTIAPHHFRDLIGWSMSNNTRCRIVCSIGGAIGLTLLVLGLFVY
ncbi:MAG: hypothetical protein ABSC38_03375 [Verrucomicrobiia bacterium]